MSDEDIPKDHIDTFLTLHDSEKLDSKELE